MRQKVRSRTEESGKLADTSKSDDDKHRKKITKNAWDTAKSMVTITSSQEKVVTYEEAFSKIQAATGICDIDELVQNFINSEDQNFTLFKYNNELSADIEKLEQQIAEYKEEYVTLSGSGSRKEDKEQEKILTTLEERWNDIDRKAIQYEVKHQESQQTLAHVKAGIDSVFHRIGCTEDDLPSGCSNNISEANMLQYLAAIEGRTNDLVKL